MGLQDPFSALRPRACELAPVHVVETDGPDPGIRLHFRQVGRVARMWCSAATPSQSLAK